MWYDEEELERLESEAALEEKNVQAYNRRHSKVAATVTQRTSQQFQAKVLCPTAGLALFGTVPPPKKLGQSTLESVAKSVGSTVAKLNPDGVQIYDIQDEVSRNGTKRPFRYLETHEPRVYASLLRQHVQTACIVYRALRLNETAEDLVGWCQDTRETHGCSALVLVGGPRPGPDESVLTVQQASECIHSAPELKEAFTLGGITIAERHRDRCDEPARLAQKSTSGVTFFTSQVVYNADCSIMLLRDYHDLCKKQKLTPRRLVFVFAPFASEATCQFLQWLGVEVAKGTQQRVLTRPTLTARVRESMEICLENWKRILEFATRHSISVPLGFGVESVSKSRKEQAGAAELFRMLKNEMDLYYAHRYQSSSTVVSASASPPGAQLSLGMTAADVSVPSPLRLGKAHEPDSDKPMD